MIYDLSLHIIVAIGRFARTYFGWTLPLVLRSLALLLWRLWAFTIYPLLNPGESKHLPYQIPFKLWRLLSSRFLGFVERFTR